MRSPSLRLRALLCFLLLFVWSTTWFPLSQLDEMGFAFERTSEELEMLPFSFRRDLN
jgi:hypothetical protein